MDNGYKEIDVGLAETKTIKSCSLELTNVVKLTDNFDNQEWQKVLLRGTLQAGNLSFSSALPPTLKVLRGGILINVWLSETSWKVLREEENVIRVELFVWPGLSAIEIYPSVKAEVEHIITFYTVP